MKQLSQYPMISVIIPVYNVQDYIIRCLESIVAQTYQGGIECILVDDCSKDNSVQLIEEFMSSYKGRLDFRLISLNHNHGPSEARNVGIKEAKGDLFTFVDSDDWIEPKMYEELYNLLSKDPKALFVTSGIIAESSEGLEYGHANTNKYKEGGIIEPYHFLELLLATRTNYSIYNKLYRRDFFKVSFRKGVMVGEDFLFFYDNCKTLIGKGYHFVTTPIAYYHYIIHSGSIMQQNVQSPKPWYVETLVAMTCVLDDCQSTYPDLYKIQLNRFSAVYGFYFYEIVNNKVLTTLRKNSLNILNKYVRVMPRSKFSFMTRVDMLVVSYFPNGYSIVRHIARCRKNIKSFTRH